MEAVLCAGFERGEWRQEAFVDHIMEWLPEFALRYTEVVDIGAHNAVSAVRKAAKQIYSTKKYQRRGEFGELLLHIAIRQLYDTVPAISKMYYKSSLNETVKGFDAVHVVVAPNDELELWVGETKFYKNLSKAIRDVSLEIVDHLGTDYLRDEFNLISNKIDPQWPHAARLRKLLAPQTSLDEVFNRACVPVLLTYDSSAIANASAVDAQFLADLEREALAGFRAFLKRLESDYDEAFSSDIPITVHILLVPLKSKAAFVKALHTAFRRF